jgi:hypothetical protein
MFHSSFHTSFQASTSTLKLLASLVWYSGAIVLSFKSIMMLTEAQAINPDQTRIWLTIVAGLIFGAIKAKYLFTKVCVKNLTRIDALKSPKLWDFYRLRFFIFLLAMILLGSFISRQAHGNYSMLVTMALIEISLATALLGSSHCFRKKQ